MNSPHLPDSPRRFHFRIRPFHITLAVIIALHIAAFLFVFHDGKAGGAASATSANQEAKHADVTWQHVDSLIPASRKNDPSAASVHPEHKAWAPPSADPKTAAVAALAEPTTPAPEIAKATEFPLAEAEPTPVEPESPTVDPASSVPVTEDPKVAEAVPVRAALAVEDSVGPEPGAPSSGSGSGFGDGANAGFDFGAYDLLITREFHQAWVQPLDVDTPFRRNVAKLAVSIGRDGKVKRFSLSKLTGVPELDSSVLAAARSVRRIAPLPDDYHGDSYDVVINFKLD